MTRRVLWFWRLRLACSRLVRSAAQDDKMAQLAKEVGGKGWIVYASRGDNGTWDLFLMRPDGSGRRNITNTPDYRGRRPAFLAGRQEAALPPIREGHHDQPRPLGFPGLPDDCRAGRQQTRADRRRQGVSPGRPGRPTASRSPAWRQKGIQIIDLETKKIVRQMPRKGIYQQLFWSPDGQWFCGVANARMMWTIVRMNAQTGELNIVHEFQSCTPDWFPDSKHIIYPSRPAGQPGNNGQGFTQLWYSDGEGKDAKMIYGEDDYHIYGGALSPDGKYVLFTRCPQDGGGSEKSGAPICIMRMADAPAIAGPSKDLRKVHPEAKEAPVLQLVDGWEPYWTYAEIGAQK